MKTFTIFFAKLRYLVSSIFLICTSILTINSFAQTTQTFTSSGSFTVPCNVTSIQVECWGGGGGGAGDIDNLATVSGSGGGGGGYTIGTISVNPADVISYTVGSVGAAGSSAPGAGGPGGNTTFSTVIANGGGGGAITNGAGGAGGGGSGGTVTTGANGQAGNTVANTSGAGGLAGNMGSGNGAGSSSDGSNAGTANTGGGGSGAQDLGGGNNSGSAGGTGKIIITYTGSNAGPDQNLALCATTATLAGNTPSAGTGTWSCITNCTGVSITSVNSPTSTVTGLTPGLATTLRWTISNGGCTSVTDDVVITATAGSGCWNYCTPTGNLNTSFSDCISNVTINSLNNTTTCAASGYTNYAASGTQTTTLTTGLSFTLYLTSASGTGTHGAGVWFDFNDDGDFGDADEFVLISNSISPSSTVSVSVPVPSGAFIGTTRMRVRYAFAVTVTSTMSCTMAGTYGETEDYTVSICGTNPGTISPTSATVCPTGGTTGVSISGYTGGSTFQWEVSTDGSTYANVSGGSGATTASYTTPALSSGNYYYKCKVTNGCSSYSGICTVTSDNSPCAPNPTTTVQTMFVTSFETCDNTAITTDLTTGQSISETNTTSPNIGTVHGSILGASSNGAYSGSLITPLLTFEPGCTYSIEFKVKGGVCAFSNAIKIMKSTTATNAAMLAATGSDILLSGKTPTGSYVSASASFTVTATESKYIGIQLYGAGAGGCGSSYIYVDDIRVTRDCPDCYSSCSSPCMTANAVGGTVSPAGTSSVTCGTPSTIVYCLSGSTGTIQWQQSFNGGTTYSDIIGQNNTTMIQTYNSTVKVRAELTNDGCTSANSTVVDVSVSGVTANTWDNSGSNAWGTGGNWSAGVPTSCHDVTIPSGGTQPTISAAAECHNLTINNGAKLTITVSNNIYLDIFGNLSNNGEIEQTNLGTTRGVRLSGDNATWGGTGTYTGITLYVQDGSYTTLIADAEIATLNATKTATIGTLDLGSYQLKVTTEFNQSGSAIRINTGYLWMLATQGMTLDQTSLYPDYGTYFRDYPSNTWGVSGDWSQIGGSGFYNYKVRVAGGSVTYSSNMRARNDFTIESSDGSVIFNASTPYTTSIEGNLYNNEGFTAGVSTFNFNGSIAQEIRGTVASTFYNLTIDNSSSGGVTQMLPVTVSNTFALTEGPFNLNSLTATVTRSATAAIARTSGYVVSETNSITNPSKLQWNIGSTTGAHVFPFGTTSGLYIPVTFNNSVASGNVTISTRPDAVQSSSTWASGVTNMKSAALNCECPDKDVIDRWWDISSTVSPLGGSGADVSFTFLGSENTMLTGTPNYRTGEIGIQHWTGTIWNDGKGGTGIVNLTGTTNATATTNTVTANDIIEFSPFVAVAGAAPLPVNLINFKAKLENNKVVLDWTTASEQNSKSFVVERSTESSSFENIIATVPASGNSSTFHSYQVNDNDPLKGISYYRLTQTDLDGSNHVQGVVAIDNFSKFEIVSVIPNPVTGTAYVNVYNPEPETNVTINVVTLTGQLMHSEKIDVKEGYNSIPVDMNKINKGLYMLRITSPKNPVITNKLIKQ